MLGLSKELAKTTKNTDKWNKLKQEIDKIDCRID